MSTTRISALTALAITGALALSACGSETPSTPTNPGSANSSNTSAATDCFEGNLTAEGSSAQKNAFEQAMKVYQDKCSGANIAYAATGSGAGIKQFIAKKVDFAGSDSALKTAGGADGKVEATEAANACTSPAWNLPMVAGPIAVAYNVKGIDKLILDATTMAKIFDGKITAWNDPAIAALNPGVTLPATAIKVYFRSDDSGTTENFTKYLKAAAGDAWGHDPAKKWPGSGEGKEKSAGVALAATQTDGAITYVEWSYATSNNLKMAAVSTGSGAPVELTGESAGKAVAAATQVGSGNDLALKLDYATKAEGAYPIVLVTYEIVCSKYADPAKGKKVKSFLSLMSTSDVQKSLEAKGYAPLPADVLAKVQTAVAAIS